MNRIVFSLLLIVTTSLIAQTIHPVNPDLMLEVLSESKNIDNEDQYIDVQIICETNTEVNALFLNFDKTPARWTLLSARLNNEVLWLIKTSVRATHDNVLAWDFDESINRLNLFPYNWQKPYVLDLQLQMNLHNREKLTTQSEEKITLEADLASGVFTASPTGRGDMIILR